MIHQLRNRNFYVVFAVDVVLFSVSLLAAYAVRYSLAIPEDEILRIYRILPWLLGVKVVTFFLMGVYRGMWRYTSLPDAWRLFKASGLSTLIILAGLTMLNRFQGYPRSVFIADSIFTLFLCGSSRAGIRLVYAYRHRLNAISGSGAGNTLPTHRTRLIIIGAGDAADKMIREIQGNEQSRYEVVCCVDDSPGKHGRDLLGVPIRGPIDKLPVLVERMQAAEILIAMPSVEPERLRRIVGICEKVGIPFKTLPSLSSLIDGRVTVNDLREVRFEDLLGRPPVKLNQDDIGHYLTGKTVMVTGGGGSIGSELCRQIARFKPARMVVVDAHEFNLYRIEIELRNHLKIAAVFPVLGRVQDRRLMQRVFQCYQPNVVFHAAAFKHVPMIEMNPWEAILNNIQGSRVVMDLAEEVGAERFVLVSTDKAVRPTNVMGASKRMAEIILQSRPAGKTRFMAVRFGNVLGSSGSVVPLFKRQIAVGGPVTVTDPEMTRYFMLIPEACQLILQAGSMGEGGEIFILEMGTPVKIDDMARDLIRLSGREPDRDIKIVYTGPRPGEKLYEELITHGEGITGTIHEKIMVLRRNEDVAQSPEHAQQLKQTLDGLIEAAASFDAPRVKATLQAAIPEYVPSDAGSIL